MPRRRRIAASAVAFLATVPASASALPNYSAFAPERALPDANSHWVPQGLTYWPAQDALIASYYDCNCNAQGDKLSGPPQNSQIVVMKRGSNRVLSRLILPYGGHVGGLGMTKNFLWIANSEAGDGFNVHTYKASKLLTGSASPGQGSTIRSTRHFKLAAASYMTITGSKLWVGDFDGDVAYRYTIGKGGKTLSRDTAATATVTTPNNTQGMAVKGGKAIYSTSYGRNNASTFVVRPVAAKSGGETMSAPPMSEGITFGKGGVHVLYESSSLEYLPDSKPENHRTTIDRADAAALGF